MLGEDGSIMGLMVNEAWGSRGQMGQQEAARTRRGRVLGAPASLLHGSPRLDQMLEARHRLGGGRVGGRKDPVSKTFASHWLETPCGESPT